MVINSAKKILYFIIVRYMFSKDAVWLEGIFFSFSNRLRPTKKHKKPTSKIMKLSMLAFYQNCGLCLTEKERFLQTTLRVLLPRECWRILDFAPLWSSAKKIATLLGWLFFWRRKRDSNSRAGFPTYTLSRGASSPTWVLLHSVTVVLYHKTTLLAREKILNLCERVIEAAVGRFLTIFVSRCIIMIR